jgi:hypothetical protein
MERSTEQVAREAALHEVEETLLNIEEAIRRADRGHKAIPPGSPEQNLRLCLDTAVDKLEAIRKELFQRRSAGSAPTAPTSTAPTSTGLGSVLRSWVSWLISGSW